MNKEEFVENIILKLEDYGWAANLDYCTPVVSDIIEILEKNGSKIKYMDEDRSYKGVF